MNSKRKGKVGELELVHWLRDHGFGKARRGQQFKGGADSPDVVDAIPGVHIECKRTEHLRIYESMQQAIEDAGSKMPTVFHRRNRGEWLVICRAEDFVKIMNKEQP